MYTENNISWIIGVDEAGRGPLAGPIYVGVFAIPLAYDHDVFREVRDSKMLSEGERNVLYEKLIELDACKNAVAYTNPQSIDKYGISWSTQNALERALRKLNLDPRECRILLDGGLQAPSRYHFQETIIKGDRHVPIISAASILAKVSRDRKMCKIAQLHEVYKFEQHKGYGTRMHMEKILQHGLCTIHRRTYCRNIVGLE